MMHVHDLRSGLASLVERDPRSAAVGAAIGVIVDYGHSDVGSCFDNTVAKLVSTIPDGVRLIGEYADRATEEFLSSIEFVSEGIDNGSLVDEGGSYYLIAQVLTPNPDGASGMFPVAGFAVEWAPSNGQTLTSYSWEDAEWDSWFPEAS